LLLCLLLLQLLVQQLLSLLRRLLCKGDLLLMLRWVDVLKRGASIKEVFLKLRLLLL